MLISGKRTHSNKEVNTKMLGKDHGPFKLRRRRGLSVMYLETATSFLTKHKWN